MPEDVVSMRDKCLQSAVVGKSAGWTGSIDHLENDAVLPYRVVAPPHESCSRAHKEGRRTGELRIKFPWKLRFQNAWPKASSEPKS